MREHQDHLEDFTLLRSWSRPQIEETELAQPGFPWLSPIGPSGTRLEESLPGTDMPNRLTAVARDESGRIIGTLYFGCRLIVDPEVEIAAFVAPEHRRQGGASRLYSVVHE